MDIDRKSGDLHPKLVELVVPPEGPARPREAQCGEAGGDVRGPGCVQFSRRERGGRLDSRDLGVVRELVQKVGERLGVHQAMLDRHVEDRLLIPFGAGGSGPIEALVHDPAHALVVVPYGARLRPIRRWLVRKPPPDRVDSEGEQAVECLVEGLDSEGLSGDEVPVERLDMPEVKHEPVALWDGALVERLGFHNRENLVRPGAGLCDPGRQGLAGFGLK